MSIWQDKTVAINFLRKDDSDLGFAISDGENTYFYSSEANFESLINVAKNVIAFNSFESKVKTKHNFKSLYYQVKPATKFQTLSDIVKSEYFTGDPENYTYFCRPEGARQCCTEALFMKQFYVKHYKNLNKSVLKLDNALLEFFTDWRSKIRIDQAKLRTELSVIQKNQWDTERRIFKQIGYPVISLNQVDFDDRYEGIERDFEIVQQCKQKYDDLIPYLDLKSVNIEFDTTATATGRILCRDRKNNIGLFTPDKQYRDLFISNGNMQFVSADYIRQEANILATVSEDEQLLEDLLDDNFYSTLAQNSGMCSSKCSSKDVSKAASKTVSKSSKAVSKATSKQLGKLLFYAIIYGMKASTLADQLGESINNAELFIKRFKKMYSSLNHWLVKFDQKTNYFGRKLHENTVNAYVQSTAADIIRDRLIATKQCNPILVLADNIIYEVPADRENYPIEVIEDLLNDTSPFNLKVKLEVSDTLKF